MGEGSRDPERWLKAARQEAASAKAGTGRGQLKIFFGYAAGVGKTYAMLKAARAARQRGIDVVAGYVEPHARPETAALLAGLESLPFLSCRHNGLNLNEFDLDAALARRPALLLLDELAHSNAPGCRHTKRYLDVKELLKAGIDVWTTVNVQHLESLHDSIAAITGISVRERFPDAVFDEAAQVELVDIEPEELLERLRAGKIYRPEQADRALANFFTLTNLTALREIALRRCADRVNRLMDKARAGGGDYHTDEHILVGLSSSPSNAKIIRTGARMAAAFKGSFTALLVETPAMEEMTDEDRQRLQKHIDLARRLGAVIEIVHGDDIALQIAEFARLSGVSKIVIGRSGAARRAFGPGQASLTEQLCEHAPNIDLYIIPDSQNSGRYKAPRSRKAWIKWQDIPVTAGLLLAASACGFIFQALKLGEANIITVFVLAVLLISVITANRIVSGAAALLSVLAFNFFFTEPRYTLLAYDKNYPVTFGVMFAAALISGTLAAKLRSSARQSARAAFRTQILLDTNQLLQQAQSREEIAAAAARQLVKLLNRDILFYLSDPAAPSGLAEPLTFPAEAGSDLSPCLTANEKAVAAWVCKNNTRAGRFTQTLPNARCLYLAVRVNDNVYGVLAIALDKEPLDAFANSIMLSILGECAMALESERHAREKESAAILAKNEQLRANLLRAISHDLRTPLTSIAGNAGNLLANSGQLDEAAIREIGRAIGDDADWLINLVENLLSVTRLEEGRLQLSFGPELLEDVVAAAVSHMQRRLGARPLIIRHEQEFLLARMDPRLIVQVLINLLDNALKYTPPDSPIEISTGVKDGMAAISVADQGPGIPDSQKAHIFEMFYSGSAPIADSRRSLGLGLALCRSIVNAHGGAISLADNVPQGSIFTFTLPIEEVQLHEPQPDLAC